MTPVPTMTVTPTQIPTHTPVPTVTPTITSTPVPTATPTVLPTPTITSTPTVLPTNTPSPTIISTPSPTITITPTPTFGLGLPALAYWKFDEGTGDIASDHSGNGYDLSLVANTDSPVWSSDLPPSSNSNTYSIYFDGNNYAKLSNFLHNPVFDFTSGFTVELWFKPDFTGLQDDSRGIIGKYDGSDGWMMKIPGTVGTKVANVINTSSQISTGQLINGQWYHIAITWDGSRQKTYIDGVSSGFLDNSQAPRSSSNRFYLAAYDPPNHNAKGYMDEIKIYNYALSAEEIQNDAGMIIPTVTVTPTITPTVIPTVTSTPAPTLTITPTITPTMTVAPTITTTPTQIPTSTPVPTVTSTPVPTATPTILLTPTVTVVPSPTPTLSPDQYPVAYWKMEENGNIIHDSSGRGNDLEIVGDSAPSWQADIPPTSHTDTKSLYFDGSTHAEIPYLSSDTDFDFSTAFTIEAWMKVDNSVDQSQNNAGIVSKWSGEGYIMWLAGEHIDNYISDNIYGNSHLFNPDSVNVTDGEWHHVVILWDGVERSIYIDGINKATVPWEYAPKSVGSPFRLGAYEGIGQYKGYLDEVRVYNYARSPQQISEDAGRIEVTITPTPTTLLLPTNTPTPSPTVEVSVTPTPTPTVAVSVTPTPTAMQLSINEFVPDTTSPNNEWVEFHNLQRVDLSGYWIDDDDNFLLDDSNESKKSLLSINTTNPDFPTIDITTAFFNNSGDDVVLFSPDGVIIDQYHFSSDPGKDVSIGRKPDGGSWQNCLNTSKGASNDSSC
ncbi:hypothetical protein COV53_05635 [Candidatus Gottesmanbacteria bacterium CG11_big_fil_rev_8_21_14_0_20_37_11]|uniref:LTD domain-containing protein n=3 Tax=Candidatus Gottesmaniibacteriota TaxID=1752720 RepID=A0A1J4TU07_9BACT|nr:MAG: hypothetical protein AUJ73_02970 [Candidatus Gottesmanbacteria bacterium CG1_02_37_22]PIP32770.1 MAG: hypothetical protein COX23_03000 [Candidatus Gottesmanbacteria bacterium CG23_combo_of_CG06-09_8_20_14_all_37_19]PIR07940.1 MAG: hypothetical protein COV53_05635 [Candidatus Gottesmanbacteria bacterium CG11_big_fil_rev_8_21_14_0_20_37_11]